MIATEWTSDNTSTQPSTPWGNRPMPLEFVDAAIERKPCDNGVHYFKHRGRCQCGKWHMSDVGPARTEGM